MPDASGTVLVRGCHRCGARLEKAVASAVVTCPGCGWEWGGKTMRRTWTELLIVAAGLVIGGLPIGGCASAPTPAPEAAAKLPPELLALPRAEVGQVLLSGLLAYQQLRPSAVQACGAQGATKADCLRELDRLDGELRSIWERGWKALFVWPAPQTGVDWGQALSRILEIVGKLAKVALPLVLGAIRYEAPGASEDGAVGAIETMVVVPVPPGPQASVLAPGRPAGGR